MGQQKTKGVVLMKFYKRENIISSGSRKDPKSLKTATFEGFLCCFGQGSVSKNIKAKTFLY